MDLITFTTFICLVRLPIADAKILGQVYLPSTQQLLQNLTRTSSDTCPLKPIKTKLTQNIVKIATVEFSKRLTFFSFAVPLQFLSLHHSSVHGHLKWWKGPCAPLSNQVSALLIRLFFYFFLMQMMNGFLERYFSIFLFF